MDDIIYEYEGLGDSLKFSQSSKDKVRNMLLRKWPQYVVNKPKPAPRKPHQLDKYNKRK
jgi:hypothetical protein